MKFNIILLLSLFFSIFADVVSCLIKREECYDFRIRNDNFWSFLVCESDSGWSAIHVTIPMATVFVFQNIWIAILIPIIFEPLEQLVLSPLAFSIAGYRSDSFGIETLAGSEIGDALFNGMMGVLLGFLIVYIFKIPPLIPFYDDVPKGKKIIWFKYFGLMIIYYSMIFFATIISPADCAVLDPINCDHLGLVIMTALRPLYYISFYFLCSLPIDEQILWKIGEEKQKQKQKIYVYPKRARIIFLVVWWLVELSIHIQNMQFWIPLYLGDGGGYYQVWLSVGILVVIFSVTIIILQDKHIRLWFDTKFLGNPYNKKIMKKSILFNWQWKN